MHRGKKNIDNGWDEFGGYMRAKKTKLEDQFSGETSTNLFRGVSIYVNGYTVPPASKLRALITQNGGRYQAYYSRATVTHTIADRLPTSKINRLTDQKVVRATWITDSIEAKKLLPWQQYELYPNRSGGVGQQRLQIVPVQVPLDENISTNEPSSMLGVLTDASAQQFPTEISTDPHSDASNDGATIPHVPTRVRRVQQMRLDVCLSPPKPTAAAALLTGQPAGSCKSAAGVISLKQLLQAGSDPRFSRTKQVVASSLDKVGSSTTPDSRVVPIQNAPATSELTSRTDQQLATFYARSRLHHLSSWANELHQLVDQFRDNAEHRCDLGETWKQTIMQKLNEQAADEFQNPIVLRLTARLSAKSSPQTISSTTPPVPPPLPRILFHIDMDCFFVSVSLRDRPDLKDKPVAVTHVKQRETDSPGKRNFGRNPVNSMSEIASCSYAARRAGCKNGMLLGHAKKLCPELQTVPYDFEAYKAVSETLYTIVSRFTLAIEAVSCDELYADCTDLLMLPSSSEYQGPEKLRFLDGYWYLNYQLVNPLVLGAHLRGLVRNSTGGCTASIGFGTTRLLARLATKRAKPDGQWFLLGISGGTSRNSMPSIGTKKDPHWEWLHDSDVKATDDEQPYSTACELTGEDARWFRNLPISELPGIGDVLVERLSTAFSVHTCGELMESVTRNQLIRLLGSKTGSRIYDLSHGRDEGICLQLVRQSKSVSACMNYGIRLQSHTELNSLVKSLCQELVSRMAQTISADAATKERRSRGVLGRCLTVRVFVRAPNAPVESAKYMGHGICTKASRMHSFPEPTADVALLQRTTLSILRCLCPNPKELRGLGLQMNKLSASDALHSVRKPVIPKVFPGTTEENQLLISMSPSMEVSAKEIAFTSPPPADSDRINTDTGSGPAVVTPQRSRRRSLRLKPRVSFKDSIPTELVRLPLTEESGETDKPITVNTECERNEAGTVETVSVPPVTPPRNLQTEHREPSEYHLQLDGSNDILPICSTPRHPPRTTVAILPRHPPASKRTRQVAPKSRARGVRLPKSERTQKLPAITEPELGPITQAMSNPIGLFEGKTLEQLKQIFADWITSEQCPLLEDVCILATYLIRLVPRDLDRVRSCLIILDRLISQLAEPQTPCRSSCDWRNAYRRIGDAVALAVRNSYGNVKLQLRFPVSIQ